MGTAFNLRSTIPYAKWFYIEIWGSGSGGAGGTAYRQTGATSHTGGASGTAGGYKAFLLPADAISLSSNTTFTIGAGGTGGNPGLANVANTTLNNGSAVGAGGAGSVSSVAIPLRSGVTVTLASPAPNAGGTAITTTGTASAATNTWTQLGTATNAWGWQDATDIATAGMQGQSASLTAQPTQLAFPADSLATTQNTSTQTGKSPTGGAAGGSVSATPGVLNAGVPPNFGNSSFTATSSITTAATTSAGTLTTTTRTSLGQDQKHWLSMTGGASLSVGQYITGTNAYVVAANAPYQIAIRSIVNTSATAFTVDTGSEDWIWRAGQQVTISGTSVVSGTSWNSTWTIASVTATGFSVTGTSGLTSGARMISSGLVNGLSSVAANGQYTISVPIAMNAVAGNIAFAPSTAANGSLFNHNVGATPGFDILTTGWAGTGGFGGGSILTTAPTTTIGVRGGDGGWPAAGGGGGGAARINSNQTTTNGSVTGSISGTDNRLTVSAVVASQTATCTNTTVTDIVTTASGNFGLMNCAGTATGTLTVGMVVSGSTLPAGTRIVAKQSGTGGTGTYIIHGLSLAAIGTNFTVTGTGVNTFTTGAAAVSSVAPNRYRVGDSVSGTGVATGTSIIARATFPAVNVSAINAYWGGGLANRQWMQGFVVTTSAAHNLSVGDMVQIAGTSSAAVSGVTGWANIYNGYWIVSSVPSTTTFFVYHHWTQGTFTATYTASSASFNVTTATNEVVTGATVSSAGATGPGSGTTYTIASRGTGTGQTGTYNLSSSAGVVAATNLVTLYALVPGAAGAAGTVTKIDNGGTTTGATTLPLIGGRSQSVASTTLTTSVAAIGGQGGNGGRGHVRIYWY